MKKKEYIRPEMECVEFDRQPQLLVGSGVSSMSVSDDYVDIAGDDEEGIYGY